MTNRKQKIGKWGEEIAVEFLRNKGYQIVEQNRRTPFGEVDVVAILEDITVFVEVKTRTNDKYGLPEAGLTRRKLNHMLNCAEHLAAESNLETWQCDAISVEGTPGSIPHIEHFENVTYS